MFGQFCVCLEHHTGAPLEPVQLFDIAAQQSRWLSASQAAIAGNIANANTPGYKAQTVRPFAEVLDKTALQLTSTAGGHMNLGAAEQQIVTARDEDGWETSESGNSVSLEQEMIRAGEVHRDFSMNTGIVKAFHGMLMAAVKV